MLLCFRATTLESTKVTTAMMTMSFDHIGVSAPKDTSRTRVMAAKPAAFEPTERKAVTGVGAPWYTSGDHAWKGTRVILKAKPARMKAEASARSGVAWA